MKNAFLDANALFSAAYSDESAVRRLWELASVRLYTSQYAVEEARRNLRDETREARLDHLVNTMRLVPAADERLIPPKVVLAQKDRPILAAAIAARVHFLVTGDAKDFGPYHGRCIAGAIIIRPSELSGAIDKARGKK